MHKIFVLFGFFTGGFLATLSSCTEATPPTSRMEQYGYKICLQDSVLSQTIKAYCTKNELDPKQACLAVTAMKVYGGQCTFISHIRTHPSFNNNYPNYWDVDNGFLVFVYDSVFKDLCDQQRLEKEIDGQLTQHRVRLAKHSSISEPRGWRILEIGDSVTVEETDFFPKISSH